MSRVLASCVSAAALAVPQLALACPVCFDPNETARDAFFSTAVFLTILPLGMIVGTTWYLMRRARARDEAEALSAPVRA